MSIQLVSEFSPRWSIFWATTYTFDLGFLDEFLFRRLGNPPLNATILVDFDQFTRAWDDVRDSEEGGLQRVNRDYLLRGVSWSTGAFHPKTYFLGNGRDGVLLVGSGNLRLEGMDQGREVFCRFSSGDEPGMAAIRAWHDWMERIVVSVDDREVGIRWRDLQSQAIWLAGARDPSHFVTNWSVSLFDQLIQDLRAPADELHVLAPFFDRDAYALQRLIAATHPLRIHLYLPQGISADGEKVRDVLVTAGAGVHILGFSEDDYVHAKLFGVTSGGQGWLLSGSANASRAALLSAQNDARSGNVEAGALVQTDADSVRRAFCPPELEIHELTIAELSKVQLRQEPEASPRSPIRLQSAANQSDGTISVQFVPQWTGALSLSSSLGTVRLASEKTTGPLALPDSGALVWIVDSDGFPLSNKVPVDDPVRLRSWLKERVEPSDRPRELSPQDFDTPIGRLLEQLNREYIFDIDDTAAASGAARFAGSEDQDGENVDFWERFAVEELRLDPRAARYERDYLPSEIGFQHEEDDLSALLRSMLDRVREERVTAIAAEREAGGVGAPGRSWTPTRRLQVRLENVLRRWSRALADPRLSWLGDRAALRNYTALVTVLGAICEYWSEEYLREEQLIRVAFDLFSSFITGERQPGYLLRMPEDERSSVLAELEATPAIAAALAFTALQPAIAWKDRVFEWQPFLRSALQFGIMNADGNSVALVHAVTGLSTTPAKISEELRRAAIHTTDERWETRMEAELGLERIEIAVNPASHNAFPVKLEVWGVKDPLNDPALISLVRRTFSYRSDHGIMLVFPDGAAKDRMSFKRNGAAYAFIDGVEYECEECATESIMEELENGHAGWREFMTFVGE